MRKKWLSNGGHPKKIKKKSGAHVKSFSKTFKWCNVLRVHVSKNQIFSNFRGHMSKIDFAQIFSRCSLLCL